jgi:hypothetical protein
MGAVAKSYMRKSFVIYEEMCKYLVVYEEAVNHILFCNRSLLDFLIFEKNFVFFFISVVYELKMLCRSCDSRSSVLCTLGYKDFNNLVSLAR